MEKDIRRVTRAIGKVREDIWFVSLLTGLAASAAVTVGVLFQATVLESVIHAPAAARWVLLLLVVGASGWACVRLLVVPLFRRTSDEAMAVLIERRVPGLSNALINAVQLSRVERGPSPVFLRKAVEECAARVKSAELSPAVDRSELKAWGLGALVVAVLASGAVALRGEKLSNAFFRIFQPWEFIPARGSVRIVKVSPGDYKALAGSDVAIEVEIKPLKGRTAAGRLHYRRGGAREVEKPLTCVDRTHFGYVLRAIEARTDYRVEIGDTQSRIFTIEVVQPPVVTGVDLDFTYPVYTHWPPKSAENTTGDIEAPVGTYVRLKVKANKPLEKGYLDVEGTRVPLEVAPDRMSASSSVKVERSCEYSIHLRGKGSGAPETPVVRKLTAREDQAPKVKFVSPARDLECAPGGELKLALTAGDDYELKRVRILFRRNEEGEWRTLKEWIEFPSLTQAALGHRWRLDRREFEEGDSVTYFSEAADRLSKRTGRSGEWRVRIVDPAKKRRDKLASLEEILRRMREVLKWQRSARALTAAARKSRERGEKLVSLLRPVKGEQVRIRDGTRSAGEACPEDDSDLAAAKTFLLRLAANEMPEAVRLVEAALAAGGSVETRDGIEELLPVQDGIIRKLEGLLGVIPKAMELVEAEEDEEEGFDLPQETEDELRKLRDLLKEFAEEQRKVLDATADLMKTPVDDLTDEQKEELQALAAVEDKWEKFLKEAHSDLSKLPKQDMTVSQLLEELIEVYSDVEMAEGALTENSHEIAVPLEQAGLELAESMTTHIEKWLPDTPDRDKWSMEEALGEYETPMAELPSELEDLIGDLMEEEEDLFQEADDVTSGWADSIDKGAGWDAMDGPISNMSAQGVTGNRLPNTSEIGGRSGEGRTGKAAGEFVEDSATGKGGRRTPTRLTPDSYLPGQIKDTSQDPAGGSTGGGKLGAGGGEGLEGPVPPEVKGDFGRLAGKQAELRNKAEKVALRLKLVGYPEKDIEATLRFMRQLEGDFKDGRYTNIARRKAVILGNLRSTRMFVEGAVKVRLDASSVPKVLLDELSDATGESDPRGFEDLLRAYRRAIARGEEE